MASWMVAGLFRRTNWKRLAACVVVCAGAVGCSRLKPKPVEQYVYVTYKQQYLRDRVAAVSNRTGLVVNGDKLKVLEHGRKFLKVQTAKGEVGWIEERAVVTDAVPLAFDQLAKDHAKDTEVASAVVRDEVYLHLKPGRDTDKFYRLAEGDKLKLLRRATLPKLTGGQAVARMQKAIPQAKGTNAAVVKPADAKPAAKSEKAADAPEMPPPVMEDWWLVRDAQGRTGWMLSRMMDVDAPESLTRYAEGQRIIGAYVLTTVADPEAGDDVPDKAKVPVYLTVMGPYKAGLPYDFDQVRVFTWSTKKHRYETGFREKNIEGYLPVTVKVAPDLLAKPGTTSAEPAPTFTYQVLAADAPPVVPDETTGLVTPGRTVTRTFRLEANYVRRVAVPGAASEAVAHPVVVSEKKDKKDKGKKKK